MSNRFPRPATAAASHERGVDVPALSDPDTPVEISRFAARSVDLHVLADFLDEQMPVVGGDDDGLIPVSRRMRTHRRNWSSIVSISSRASLVSFSPNSSISCDVTSTSWAFWMPSRTFFVAWGTGRPAFMSRRHPAWALMKLMRSFRILHATVPAISRPEVCRARDSKISPVDWSRAPWRRQQERHGDSRWTQAMWRMAL